MVAFVRGNNGETVTMQSDEGDMTVSSSETSLPDDWPSDMPVHGDGREAWVFRSRPSDGPTGIAIQVQGP